MKVSVFSKATIPLPLSVILLFSMVTPVPSLTIPALLDPLIVNPDITALVTAELMTMILSSGSTGFNSVSL